MLTPLSGYSADLYQGGRWVFDMLVGDDDGNYVDQLPTISVVAPNGTTPSPTIEHLETGYYRASLVVSITGRYVATATATGYGVTAFVAFVSTATAASAFPTLADVKTYLGQNSASDATVQDALDAETAAQRATCRIPAVYSADLAQALKRRVARNLAVRNIPLAVFQGDADSGSLTPPNKDPEVRRLEAPYRKLVQP